MFDPVSIGLTLLGAALSAKSQSDAASKARRMAVESQQRSLQAQNQATDAAMRRVQEFTPEARQDRQQDIAGDLTQRFEQAAATPITAQGVTVGQTIPGGTTDYLTAKARETTKATESSRALAALFGRLGAAGQLRRDEAVGIGDTAGDIGRIGAGANNMAGIDEIGINSVQPSLGATIAGQALQGYGLGQIASGGLFGSAPSDVKLGSAALGDNPDALFGLGLRKTAPGLGLKSSGSWLMPQG